MPQGVEHIPLEALLPHPQNVRIPLMPQGVEHLAQYWPQWHTVSEDSIDAARR